MAFTNVDVASLRSTINSCKNSINYNKTTELISDVSNNNVWQTAARDNLKKSLEKLKNNRYKDLENKLETYLEVTNLIEKYKKLEQENIRLEAEYNSLKPHLYHTEHYTNRWGEHRTRTIKDEGVERQMNNIRNTINRNKIEMVSLERKVKILV